MRPLHALVAASLLSSIAVAEPSPPGLVPLDASDARLAAEARDILDPLLAVDTSDGHETDALRPIQARLVAAGLHPELVESSPGHGNLVARLHATHATKRPLLLLAHVDVVPTTGQPWTTPPFRPTVRDGELIARGVADDKSMAAAFTAITLALARAHTEGQLARDVVLALTSGEEAGGFTGVQWLLAHRRDLLDAELALNENGAVVLTPDGERPEYATVQAAEKTYQSFRLTVRGHGGHSSLPPPDPAQDPILRLGRALVRVGELRFPAHVVPSVREGLAARATLEKEPLASALVRASRLSPTERLAPADEKLLLADSLLQSQLRTTCVATQLEASPADNVLPTAASAVVNCRILPDETREEARDRLARAIDDPLVELAITKDEGFGPPSPVGSEVVDAVKRAIARAWPTAKLPVVSSLSAGASDSRFLRAVGMRAYGVTAVPATLVESRTAHGPDERRGVRWLGPGVRLLRDVVVDLATSR